MKVFLFLSLVCALAVASGAGDRSPVGLNIVVLEKAWNQAYKFRDKTALSTSCTTPWCWSMTMAVSKPRAHFWQALHVEAGG